MAKQMGPLTKEDLASRRESLMATRAEIETRLAAVQEEMAAVDADVASIDRVAEMFYGRPVTEVLRLAPPPREAAAAEDKPTAAKPTAAKSANGKGSNGKSARGVKLDQGALDAAVKVVKAASKGGSKTRGVFSKEILASLKEFTSPVSVKDLALRMIEKKRKSVRDLDPVEAKRKVGHMLTYLKTRGEVENAPSAGKGPEKEWSLRGKSAAGAEGTQTVQ